MVWHANCGDVVIRPIIANYPPEGCHIIWIPPPWAPSGALQVAPHQQRHAGGVLVGTADKEITVGGVTL